MIFTGKKCQAFGVIFPRGVTQVTLLLFNFEKQLFFCPPWNQILYNSNTVIFHSFIMHLSKNINYFMNITQLLRKKILSFTPPSQNMNLYPCSINLTNFKLFLLSFFFFLDTNDHVKGTTCQLNSISECVELFISYTYSSHTGNVFQGFISLKFHDYGLQQMEAQNSLYLKMKLVVSQF